MEFAAASLTSFAELGGAIAPAATGAFDMAGSVGTGLLSSTTGAAGLLGSLGQTSTWAGILSGGATVMSVLAAKRAGEAEGRKLEFQALDAETEVRVEEIKGLERRNSIKAALVDAIGERDVAAAASGVDLTFGTPVTARRQASADTERALGNDKATEDFRKSRLRERAANYRIAAAEAREAGLAKAAGIGLQGAASILRRG